MAGAGSQSEPLAAALPHSLDAERSILGAILLDNSIFPENLEADNAVFSPGRAISDFFLEQHRVIFLAMKALREKGSPIDMPLLTEYLLTISQLDRAGGPAYISALADGLPRATNVKHYVEIVKKKSALRRAIYEAQRIITSSLESGADPASISASLSMAADRVKLPAANGNGHGYSLDLMPFLGKEYPAPDHLVEGVIPRGGSALMFALPHRLKSWFTLALALQSTRRGMIMGTLECLRPVRTMLVQVEDFPGQVQWRMKQLLACSDYHDCDPDNVKVIERQQFDAMRREHPSDERWLEAMTREVELKKCDHIIFDVLRRVFLGDINSPKDTAVFLESVDRLRTATGCAVTLVHHSNKKEAELMSSAAGSYNLPGWANVVMEFKRKTIDGAKTLVEIEIDNKLAVSPEPMRMVLDLGAGVPLRLETLDEGVGLVEAMERLGGEWTVRDLAEALEVHKANAYRRLKKWVASGTVERITGGKRGGNHRGGLARFRFISDGE